RRPDVANRLQPCDDGARQNQGEAFRGFACSSGLRRGCSGQVRPPGDTRMRKTHNGKTRLLISESWRRSLAAGIDPEVPARPPRYDADVLEDARQIHPLDRHLPTLRRMLRGVADATAHLMAITDAEGHVLWSEGPRDVRRRADGIGLIEGFHWS